MRPRPASSPHPRAEVPRQGVRKQGIRRQGGVRRRSGVTGRAAVLALVVCALALSLAYPLRELFAQRAEIAALHERIADQQTEVAALEAAKARWDDPAYVKAQARERLHFVMPGETQYVVVDPPPAESEGARARGAGASVAGSSDQAWFARLWASTQQSARS